MSKDLPFDIDIIEKIAAKYGTPFHLYDEKGMLATARDLNTCFDWSPDYRNYFAVKANPNPYVLEVLKGVGMGADASSLPELLLAEAVGLHGEDIMFSSNNTPPEEYRKAYELGAIINLDDINQIAALETALGDKFPELICFRYNPGPDFVTAKDNVIGNPQDAKFGVTTKQLPDAYRLAKDKGARRFGFHAMIVSNERTAQAHVQTAELLFKTAVKLSQELGIRFDFINLGGGPGIPYRPDDKPLDLMAWRQGVSAAYQDIIVKNGLAPVRIVTECGRFVTGPHGYLVTRVRSVKDNYHRDAGVDATMADLMRPGMYDAYHHVTVLNKAGPLAMQRVVGGLCENNDKFTGSQDRELPLMEPGDLVVIHDTGAHGYAMGFNYNGKLRHAELLLKTDGTVQQIRRAETIDDYFATLDYPGLT